ncbi:unnamed protein product, partial [Rotaria sp. Silwood1]
IDRELTLRSQDEV